MIYKDVRYFYMFFWCVYFWTECVLCVNQCDTQKKYKKETVCYKKSNKNNGQLTDCLSTVCLLAWMLEGLHFMLRVPATVFVSCFMQLAERTDMTPLYKCHIKNCLKVSMSLSFYPNSDFLKCSMTWGIMF